MKLQITPDLSIEDSEVDMDAIRAQGAGGQNVNKVSSAVHLRFDISSSSLPDLYKSRLLELKDKRISSEGVIVMKAQQFRTQLKNKDDALFRLFELIRSVMKVATPRRATRPSFNAKKKRMDSKTKQGHTKRLRRDNSYFD
ncbi:MAG: ribosome-associated protein [Oleiphilaceae bacterium]|jgi:ribosome-associated protein